MCVDVQGVHEGRREVKDCLGLELVGLLRHVAMYRSLVGMQCHSN